MWITKSEDKVINEFIKKLRKAADALDELLAFDSSNHSSARKKIEAAIIQEPEKKERKSTKGFKYSGTHWTQKPENKARLSKMLRKGSKARKANAKA